MSLLSLPETPFTAEVEQILSFSNYFRSEAGFFAVYKHYLLSYHKPSRAYEATENLHVYFFTHRRFSDRESFNASKARYNRKMQVKL